MVVQAEKSKVEGLAFVKNLVAVSSMLERQRG
jgi:hypothetical protein